MRPTRLRSALKVATPVAAVIAITWWITGAMVEHQAKAERERCGRSLSQLAWALLGYQSVHGSFPAGTQGGGCLSPEQRISWVPLVLSFTDYYQSMRYLFGMDRPWDSVENRFPRIESTPVGGPSQILSRPEPPDLPRGLACRANHCKTGPGLPGPIHYVGIAGMGTDAPYLPSGHPRAGVFGYDRQTRMADITDGAATTMLLAETMSANGPWTTGGPATVRGLDQARQPYHGPNRQFGGLHRGGTMVAFADGSVRFVRETINPSIFEGLSTIAGGEVLPEGWDR
jgi:prepilin-type processing-associated H-X9-DG protein